MLAREMVEHSPASKPPTTSDTMKMMYVDAEERLGKPCRRMLL